MDAPAHDSQQPVPSPAFTVAVAGASGYAGGELIRLLLNHPHVELGTLTAHSQAGQTLGSIHPQLIPLAGRVLEETTAENLAGHDVVFLALPHGQSAALAAELPADTVVIDAGADHRLRSSAAWEEFYGGEHAGTWPYGLPELPGARSSLAAAKRIAVPGCYPTGAQLALAPGFAAGVLEREDVVIVSASGTSGAGRSLKTHLLGTEVMGGMNPYGVGGVHRHTPEIEQGLSAVAGEDIKVSFTPTLAPMPRGILTTASAKVKAGVGPEQLRQIWEQAYGAEEFVQFLAEGQWPHTKSVQGSNYAQLQLALDQRVGRITVSVALDNLTKGTAGAGVQAMNIALGLPEASGLQQLGVTP